MGRGEPSPGADVGRGEPSPSADVGRGEPSPGADVASTQADRWAADRCLDWMGQGAQRQAALASCARTRLVQQCLRRCQHAGTQSTPVSTQSTRRYLQEWGVDWYNTSSRLLCHVALNKEPKVEGEEIVVLSQAMLSSAQLGSSAGIQCHGFCTPRRCRTMCNVQKHNMQWCDAPRCSMHATYQHPSVQSLPRTVCSMHTMLHTMQPSMLHTLQPSMLHAVGRFCSTTSTRGTRR